MKNSESISKISLPFCNASSQVKNMIPESKGYGYNYTSLGCIIDQIKPILANNGLCFIQSPTGEGEKLGIETVILHISGEYLSFNYNIPIANVKGANNTQQVGASITYGRRYALSAVFGIATETDTDAAFKKEEKVEKVPEPPKTAGENPFNKYSPAQNIKEDFAKAGKSDKLTDEEKEHYRKKYGELENDEDGVMLLVEMEQLIGGR